MSHRVALITGVLDLGGTTTFLCNFAGELIRRGIPAEVFSFEQDNPLAADFGRSNIPVFTADHHRLIYEDRLLLILRELRRFQPTVVIANLSATSFEVLRYVPPGVYRIGTAQSHDPGVYHIIRFYAADLDLLATVSKAIQQTVETMPEFARVPVRYLPLGVPMPSANPDAGDAGASSTTSDKTAPLRILYLGRLQREQKRVQLFPEILRVLQASGMPFQWTIAGTGPEATWLREAMKTSAPGQSVSFPGKVLYAEVPQLLAAHDVFLLASSYEGLPLSLVEAMGSGLVPVVSDLPSGVRELVDESTGKCIAPENTRGYAEAIIWLDQHRPEMRRLARNARTKVRAEFSVAAMTDRWLGALPVAPSAPLAWPERWNPKPILESPQPWRFAPPVRWLRRWLRRLRG